MAQLFINHHDLKNEDIRYITSRGYQLNSVGRVYDIAEFYNYLESEGKVNKIFYLKKRVEILDGNINSLVENKQFRVYLPQFNHSLFQIIASHRLCEKVVLVEEGITSYKLDERLYKKVNIKFSQILSLFYSNRFLFKNKHYCPYPENKFEYAICINEECFPYISNKRVLEIKSQIVDNYRNYINSKDAVLILDSFKERAKIKDEDYLKIIRETLELLKTEFDRLYVKFHPEQGGDIRSKTLKFIESEFNYSRVICLKDSCILEFEFLKSKNLTVIGMHTSLLYYAKLFGHNVISSIKITSKLPEISDYIDHVMDERQKKEYFNYE
ncbi:polysialyltransferase family glycosyltransferase [Mangrovimonas sp. DI 80]|uniref:polysialyltransferase family glycosyltransferase n=1 Tax=Mangrovimonas sp. DI 80 TaxID=1779330 RepID=UPI000F4F8A64